VCHSPQHPRELISSRREGYVDATFVVDSTGRVDPMTVRVLHSDEPLFTRSVLEALRGMRFLPAEVRGAPSGSSWDSGSASR
jgi:TonB family protein